MPTGRLEYLELLAVHISSLASGEPQPYLLMHNILNTGRYFFSLVLWTPRRSPVGHESSMAVQADWRQTRRHRYSDSLHARPFGMGIRVPPIDVTGNSCPK